MAIRFRHGRAAGSRGAAAATAALAWIVCGVAASDGASAFGSGHDGDGGRSCSQTAQAQLVACHNEVRDDFFEANAVCINTADALEREACFGDAREERGEARALCRDQRAARRELCALLGEGRYDPDFDPADFDDDFSALTNPNPYFPLGIGSRWAYVGGDETITVEVLDATKNIEDVTCIVVNDRVEEDGDVIEDTDDWYGQRLDGTVDYCGEIARNFELFEGDDPELPELVDIEGSFKAGVDGARPGTIFLGTPVVGAVYRQEWAPGDAEDAAMVVSVDYGFGDDPELDVLVPPALANLLCNDDCVVTAEINPLEPDVFELKYYAPGIGLFLEVNPEDAEIVQLVDCNLDARCAALPAP